MTRLLSHRPAVALPDLTHDCTGWGWSCPACPHGEDGCLTAWGARRRQRQHLRRAHR